MNSAKAYDAGNVGVGAESVTADFECRGCGAMCFELCWCAVRDDRDPTPAEIERARAERLTRHELEAEAKVGAR